MAMKTSQFNLGDSEEGDNQGPLCAVASSNESHSHVTTRFKHIVNENGHAVVTGRDGPLFQYCEDEPIHIPGAIQSFGLIIALREEYPGRLTVRVVSENSHEFMGYSPNQLFELQNFCGIMQGDQADTLLYHINSVHEDIYDAGLDGPEVFSLSLITGDGETRRFWCAAHTNQAQKDLVICELELEDDWINPLYTSGTKTSPIDTNTDHTGEKFASRHINLSQPLRTFRNARRSNGEAAAMELFGALTQIQEQLGLADSFDSLPHAAASLVKDLTGFHKVMIYQFDPSWNGRIVTELVDPQVEPFVDLYQGFYFPASDIPPQARELYRINKVRLLYDRDHATSRLVCRTLEDLKSPLDMTHAYLRAISPIHIKYLAHMKVRSSMSISLNGSKDLWGLISCHSYGEKGMRVSFPVRKMCRLLGDVISRNIKRLSNASRLRARRLINKFPTNTNPSSYIITSADDLLQLLDADCGAVSIREETNIFGNIDSNHSSEVFALLGSLRMRRIKTVLASHDIIRDFPDLCYPPGLKYISGFLYMPFSNDGRDSLVFFRKGQLSQIKWGGDPYNIKKQNGTLRYLEPRSSFQAWREMVLGQSRDWSEADMETAAMLCFVYCKFIIARRQEKSSMQSSLLLANSAHEIKTPLSSIIANLEIALGRGTLDAETRESLAQSHSASKSLIFVVNDLLDRTNADRKERLLDSEMKELSTSDIGVPCTVFSPGVHAWCVNMVYEPDLKLSLDPRGFFFIEWQFFNLQGLPV
ncbi:hypothetical protein N7494_000471 [Penicillium frequentans]|uniref:Phytochrome chromophore attachment site domain-containing protein n=1 Tax=Penicillium frequentans TaxID=3151616 RepID=A0AAD6D685_9EURO|nr:hypothetical protein N7494_000471 [Penicillium glabrum]